MPFGDHDREDGCGNYNEDLGEHEDGGTNGTAALPETLRELPVAMGLGEGDVTSGDVFLIGAVGFGQRADDSGRNTGEHVAVGDDGIGADHGAGGDEAVVADLAVVEHARADTDQGAVANALAVNTRMVPDYDVIPDSEGHAMFAKQHDVILDRATATDADRRDVAADAGEWPDIGVIANFDVAEYNGIAGDEDAFDPAHR